MLSDNSVVTARGVTISNGDKVLDAAGISKAADPGELARAFLVAIAQHRFWDRQKESVPT